MKNHAVLEGLLRPPIEAYSTLVAWSVALVAIVAPWALMMPRWIGLVAAAAAAWFGWVRLQQALRIMRYQHGMKWYTVTRMAPSRVPVAPDKLYLGQGFEWTQQHTQRLRDAMQVDAKPYVTPSTLETRLRQLGRNALEQSETKGTRPLTARLAAIDSWANPLHPYPDLGGSPVLHGVGVLDEVPIALRQTARSGHLLVMGTTSSVHLHPAPGTEIDPKSLEVTGIDLDHPFRFAKHEKEALDHVFAPVRAAVKKHGCQRAILVGHNAHFDLNFLNAAVARVGHKRNPFHPFSVFDTVTLAGVAYGQTVLARAVAAAGFDWNAEDAHSAVYDAEQTARLFCTIANAWPKPLG